MKLAIDQAIQARDRHEVPVGAIITNESNEVVESLHTPITSSGTFYLPWTVPTGFDTGTYTITVSDDENSSSFEIFIQ